MKRVWLRILLWCVSFALLTALIIMTPFILSLAASFRENWGALSSISQTYSALSVLFSAIALAGVAASLQQQSHQIRVTQEEAQRVAQRELLRYSIENPDFLVCWSPPRSGQSPMLVRQMNFTHLIISSWHSEYMLRRTNARALHLTLIVHFKGEIARRHWVERSTSWRAYAEAHGDKRGIAFVDIMDNAFAEAVAAGPPVLAASYFTTSSHE